MEAYIKKKRKSKSLVLRKSKQGSVLYKVFQKILLLMDDKTIAIGNCDTVRSLEFFYRLGKKAKIKKSKLQRETYLNLTRY